MPNKKQTSPSVATQAATTLRDKNSSKTAKKLAASALSQSSSQKQTGGSLEKLASSVLESKKYSSNTKTLAGTILSQSNKKR